MKVANKKAFSCDIKLVYVAGSFRDKFYYKIHKNVQEALKAGEWLAKNGILPVIPHTMTQNLHGLGNDKFWLDGLVELMIRTDAVFVFNPKKSQKSDGTNNEIKMALVHDLPVLYSKKDVLKWLNGFKKVRNTRS